MQVGDAPLLANTGKLMPVAHLCAEVATGLVQALQQAVLL
jgi:hypothetical protein